MAPPQPPPPPSSPPVSLKVILLFLRILNTVLLVITVILLGTNTITIELQGNSIQFRFKDIYAYRYMLSAGVIGLVYALVQLFFTISQFATGIKKPFNYQLDFYGDKVMSYLLATGSAAGFGVSKDLKDAFKALILLDSKDPVDEFFLKAYASASLLLFAFISLAVLSVFSSLAITKITI